MKEIMLTWEDPYLPLSPITPCMQQATQIGLASCLLLEPIGMERMLSPWRLLTVMQVLVGVVPQILILVFDDVG